MFRQLEPGGEGTYCQWRRRCRGQTSLRLLRGCGRELRDGGQHGAWLKVKIRRRRREGRRASGEGALWWRVLTLDTESRAREEVDVTGWPDLIPLVMNLAVKSGGWLASCTSRLACSARSGSQAHPFVTTPDLRRLHSITMALRTLARSALRFTPSIPAVRPTPLSMPSRTLRLLQERTIGSSSRRTFSSSSPVLRAPAPNATGTHAHSPLVPKNGQGINRPAKNNHQFWYREVFPCKCLRSVRRSSDEASEDFGINVLARR